MRSRVSANQAGRTAVFVGTAGWSLPAPLTHAFPEGASHLARYAQVFAAAEINSTFWRRHRASTFERWRDSVPAHFRFAVKLPRTITHEAALAAPSKLLREFFADVAPLGAKLGPVLVQLAGSLAFESRRAGAFFRALSAMHEGPVVCEARHESWYAPRASALLLAHGVARVIADPPRPAAVAPSEPTAGEALLYLRLHGSPRPYYSSYDDVRLRRYAELIASCRAPAAYCIFDNTASGAAAGNALTMLELVSGGMQAPSVALRSR
jgi:uncharacterized protein YecE (DUF72 family)